MKMLRAWLEEDGDKNLSDWFDARVDGRGLAAANAEAVQVMRETVEEVEEPRVITAEEIQSDLLSMAGADAASEEESRLIEAPLAVRRGRRAAALGFMNAADAVTAKEWDENQGAIQGRDKLRRHYAARYPQCTFITRRNVLTLCKKYGLVFGATGQYIGNIPDRCLTEMGVFRVHVEDMPEWSEINSRLGLYVEIGAQTDWVDFEQDGWTQTPKIHSRFGLIAPAAEMLMDGSEWSVGRKTTDEEKRAFEEAQRVKDPIVLQPVNGGYLIVTAWGDEANDELVVNPNRN